MLNLDRFRTLAESFREDAEVLARRGCEDRAVLLRSCADDVTEAMREWALQALTLDEAAEEAGVTPDTISRRITRGELPNAGRRHRPRVRRTDLFGSRTPTGPTAEPDLASETLYDAL